MQLFATTWFNPRLVSQLRCSRGDFARRGLQFASVLMLGLFFIGFPSQSRAQDKAVAIVLMSEELDAQGKLVPLAKHVRAIFNYLEKQTGLELEIRRYPWKRALEMAINGEGIIFGISKTEEREKSLIFTSALYTDSVYLVTRCDQTFKYQQIRDLSGKVIGMVRGTSYGAEFDSQIGKLFKVEADTGSNAGRLRKLYQRRMDAFLMYSIQTSQQLAQQINQNYGAEFAVTGNKSVFCVLSNPVSQVGIHLAQAKNLPSDQFLQLEAAIVKARQQEENQRWLSLMRP